MSAKPKRVFITYSHDNEEHKLRVLELANRLRQDGVDAWIDRYVPSPAEGWPRWMRLQIEEADAVLVVCTAVYKARFDGVEPAAKGAGVRWEGLILTQTFYEDFGENASRFIPVLFDDTPVTAIPVILRPFTHFRLPDQYEELYRIITDQPAILVPPIGSLKKLTPTTESAPQLPVVSSGASEINDQSSTGAATDAATKLGFPRTTRTSPNERALAVLRDRWNAKRLTLMVGAGISVASGIPLWSQLIAYLVRSYVEKTYASTLGVAAVEAIRKTLDDEFRFLSPIQTAAFIQSRLSQSEFAQMVRDGLYQDARDNSNSELLRSIVALHRGLHGIVSFNFDDILERSLAESGILHTTVVSGRDLGHVKGLPVYHPHGFLPRSGPGSEHIVFSEAQYHTQYTANYSWSNVVVQHLLLESTCLFVGLSLSDPNLRRMIDLAHRENDIQQHYYLTLSPHSGTVQYADAIAEIYQAAHESMGITPIWLNAYDEAPQFLRAIMD